MSTPMYELPVHCKIGLTRHGDGPVVPEDPAFDHWGCWCPDPDCTLWEAP